MEAGRITFEAIGEAPLDPKLSQLQDAHMGNGEHIVEYSSENVRLVGELKIAKLFVLEIEMRHAVLRGLSSDNDVTAEAVVGEAFYMLRLIPSSFSTKHVMMTRKMYPSKCLRRQLRQKNFDTIFHCGKPDRIIKNCHINKKRPAEKREKF